jgi:predicted AlkP superfamily pyrophosphatase or phosphodiesterase
VRTFLKILDLLKRGSFIPASFAVILTACSSSATHLQKPRSNKPTCVLISIDGFRPEFYSESMKSVAPHLFQIAQQGLKAPDGMEPVFPSLTYPNHVSLVTGRYSAEHGVFANRAAASGDWYFKESNIQVPTLWQVARAHGKSVAIMRWPASMGAQVDWFLPEIFNPSETNAEGDWKLLVENTDPKFLRQIATDKPFQQIKALEDLDALATQGATWVLSHEDPDLTLVHLIGLDLAEHRSGTHSPETRSALSKIDSLVYQIISEVDPSRTTVFIVGDHGFSDVGRVIQLQSLMEQEHLAKMVDIQVDGGQAAVYLKPGASEKRALKALSKHAKGLYQILNRARLKELKAYPSALCVLETFPGTMFVNAGSSSEPLVQSLGSTKGAHGYLPDRPEMQTGLIVWGRGIAAGKDVEYAKVIDIAPTVAKALGFDFPGEGTPIDFELKSNSLPSASTTPQKPD